MLGAPARKRRECVHYVQEVAHWVTEAIISSLCRVVGMVSKAKLPWEMTPKPLLGMPHLPPDYANPTLTHLRPAISSPGSPTWRLGIPQMLCIGE